MFKKRVISLMLSLSLVMACTPVVNAQTTSNDTEGRWSYSVINKWVENDAIDLDAQGNFSPAKAVTGKEFATIIKSIAGISLTVANSDQVITRESAAVAIASALKLDLKNVSQTTFTDESKINAASKASIAALVSKGIFTGYGDGTFKPTLAVTKELAVAIADKLTTKDLLYTKGTLQTTLYGQVDGLLTNNNNTIAWLGVPYAKPPVGELRWKAPVDPAKWTGVLETKKYANMAMQLSGTKIVGSEDCLYLDIYRPNTTDTNLPVLVFVHGGNNQTGNSQSFNGDIMANVTNSIIISIEYRLGALGWISMPGVKTGNALEDSGNFGLLDIHQSLNWVNENIKAFGGNPYNVTLSGQSAGGRDVMAMLISPIFKGDYQKAFALSGGMTVTDPKVGQEIDTKAFAKLVVEDKVKATEAEAIAWLNAGGKDVTAYLRGLAGERISGLMTNAAIRMSVFPHLFADGTVLPKEGFAVFETGNYNKVPTMLGSCEDEFSVFAATDPVFVGATFSGKLMSDPVLYPKFSFANKYGSMLYTGFNADRSAEKMVEVKGQPGVYAYRFSWGHDTSIMPAGLAAIFGANHGADVDFVLGRDDNPNSKANYTTANLGGRVELSSIMLQYEKNFLYTGNPNGSNVPVWNEWSNVAGAPKLMSFNATKDTAIVEMTAKYVNETEVFKMIDADKTLSDADKKSMLSTVMSGRFFSGSFDQYFNGK